MRVFGGGYIHNNARWSISMPPPPPRTALRT